MPTLVVGRYTENIEYRELNTEKTSVQYFSIHFGRYERFYTKG